MLYLGLSRGQHAGPYDEATLKFIRDLLPHLRRSVQIQRLIGSAADAQRLSEAALDRLRIGVVLMDSARCIRFANTAALDLARLFGLKIGESGLALSSSRFNDRLQRLLNAASNPGSVPQSSGDLMTYSLPGTGILQLHIFPLKPREAPEIAGHRVQVAVFLMRPGPQTLNAGEVAIQFGLTSAESRLAVLLTEGKTVAEAAKVAGISMATARTHLRNIFAKTATSRQSELALLLLTSLAGISTANLSKQAD
ncbi:MAG: hypothetical protein KAX99_07535 [Azonexus sp.]|nr:hypothetical protein [Azonexus sp.]